MTVSTEMRLRYQTFCSIITPSFACFRIYCGHKVLKAKQHILQVWIVKRVAVEYISSNLEVYPFERFLLHTSHVKTFSLI